MRIWVIVGLKMCCSCLSNPSIEKSLDLRIPRSGKISNVVVCNNRDSPPELAGIFIRQEHSRVVIFPVVRIGKQAQSEDLDDFRNPVRNPF